MDVLLTIGEFSKMSYLSVKALRHYHDVGLLEPAHIDPGSGYRRYAATQVATAQAIRRFRDLDMPIDEIREVLEAPGIDARNQAIVAHLERMQEQLERTQTTVVSLQALLGEPHPDRPVEQRRIPPTRCLAITEDVGFDDAADWCEQVFAELHAALGTTVPSGPDGALYSSEFFELGRGACTAFVPIDDEVEPADRVPGRAGVLELPATHVAVMAHDGPFGDLDQTYGALGTVVAARGIGADGAIREHYPSDDRTEVCWPIADPG